TISAAGELGHRARPAGVQRRGEGGRLKSRAPPGAPTDELKRDLGSYKRDVISVLRQEASDREATGGVAENQHGLWLVHRLQPESAAYNVGFAARVHGEVNSDLLEESLQVLVDRHESLRTTYPLSVESPIRI